MNLHYTGNTDRDPDGTKQIVLDVLYRQNRFMTRRQIQGFVFGDNYGASQTGVALKALIEDGYVSKQGRSPSRYGITISGRTRARASAQRDSEWVGFDDCPYLAHGDGAGCGWPDICRLRGSCPDVDKVPA